MSAYLSFKGKKDGQDLFYVSRNNPLNVAFQEAINVPFNQDFDVFDHEIDEVMLYLNKEISKTKEIIYLKLLKKDFDEFELRGWIEEYEELLNTQGKVSLLYEFAFDHEGLVCHYA